MVIFFLIAVGAIIWGIAKIVHYYSDRQITSAISRSITDRSLLPQQKRKGYDTQNLPTSLDPEMRQLLYKIAARYQIRYVTQADIQQNIYDNLESDFAKMQGWDMWDASIHHAPGQLDRAERGSHLSQLPNIRYAPQFQIAKVVGTSGVYLTSYKHCSCPDFRKRHLPCKHMYALAMALDGNPEKKISHFDNYPFLGLTFALAGRFPKDDNGKTVKDKIRELGGEISENVTFYCSALVLGNNPSESKINQAKEYDMEIIASDMLETLFREQLE